MKSLPEVKLSSHYLPQFGFIYSYFASIYDFLPIFTRNNYNSPLFGFIGIYYPYLALFGHIYP